MKSKTREKERAIELRKSGLSYKDILAEVPVSKSSLSLWLHKLPLTPDEKRYLKSRKERNITQGRVRAATVLHKNRLKRDALLLQEARKDFAKNVGDPLFFTGIALYWAEGSKRSGAFHFTNSDVEMVNVMIRWIVMFCGVQLTDLGIRLYIHKPYAHEHCEEYWSKHTDVPLANFKRTVYKPTGLGIKKRPNYKGCVRIEIPRSTKYFRKMLFWQNMLVEHFKKQ